MNKLTEEYDTYRKLMGTCFQLYFIFVYEIIECFYIKL